MAVNDARKMTPISPGVATKSPSRTTHADIPTATNINKKVSHPSLGETRRNNRPSCPNQSGVFKSMSAGRDTVMRVLLIRLPMPPDLTRRGQARLSRPLRPRVWRECRPPAELRSAGCPARTSLP